jgi:DNA mismatch endonuclease (patch repair protein)
VADKFSKEVRSRIMSRIRGKHTKPELKLRRALWARGHRYRLHYGRQGIDIALVGKKVAIFVDGCFWHGCPKHYRPPKSNKAYWGPKIETNRRTDRRKNRELRKRGWRVVRIWEHELKNIDKCVAKVERTLEAQ